MRVQSAFLEAILPSLSNLTIQIRQERSGSFIFIETSYINIRIFRAEMPGDIHPGNSLVGLFQISMLCISCSFTFFLPLTALVLPAPFGLHSSTRYAVVKVIFVNQCTFYVGVSDKEIAWCEDCELLPLGMPFCFYNWSFIMQLAEGGFVIRRCNRTETVLKLD